MSYGARLTAHLQLFVGRAKARACHPHHAGDTASNRSIGGSGSLSFAAECIADLSVLGMRAHAIATIDRADSEHSAALRHARRQSVGGELAEYTVAELVRRRLRVFELVLEAELMPLVAAHLVER